MLSIPDEILDIYAEELAIAECSFELMGRLLDRASVKKRIECLKSDRLYIYGGGYLGIQFYNACSSQIKVLAVVDKKGHLRFNIEDISIISLECLKRAYKGEMIIITSVRYYQEIREDLLSFVPKTQILFLGEFLGGIIQ